MWRLAKRLQSGPRTIAIAAAALLGGTVAIGGLEGYVGVPNASAVYLVSIVAVALVGGPVSAAFAAVAAFLLYDFLFTQPYHTLSISDPGEWLSVILLLFVGIVVGQLAALQRTRAEQATAREREARALFQVSRSLATRSSTTIVLPDIAKALARDAAMDRVWMKLGADGHERLVADSGLGVLPGASIQVVLRRKPADTPAEWVRVHQPVRPGTGMDSRPDLGGSPAGNLYRVRIEAGGRALGSIWGFRGGRAADPDTAQRRLLAAAADQVGQALEHDRLAREAQAAEVARQGDELKSALLQSVSHDLRTPLAAIRTAAGTLRRGTGLSTAEQAESAEEIEREVEYLNRLVTNLLDLSRIEAGTLRAELDAFELDDLINRTIDRMRPRLARRLVAIDLHGPPIQVDPVFLDEAVTNAVDNAIKYCPPDATIRIGSLPLPDGQRVRLTIEDAGPGVPAEALPMLFDKFYRVPGAAGGSRAGSGVGLAVVRGLIEATGGAVAARPSDLGGLAIDLDLPVAHIPAELPAGSSA